MSMESIGNILGSRKIAIQPDEILTIKDYIQRKYSSGCKVKLEREAFIVSVPSSGLAATLQLEKNLLIKKCGLKNKKLVIRTGR